MSIETVGSLNKVFCYHCALPVISPVRDTKQNIYCCNGCKQVSELLASHDLSKEYYSLKKNGVVFSSPPLKIESLEAHTYMDKEEFFQEYGGRQNKEEHHFSFYLEGIHCVACLWLLEKLSAFNDQIYSSSVDLSTSVILVRYHSELKLSSIASLLLTLGYKPIPLKNNNEGLKLKQQENRREFIRVAIVGACTSNIMFFAIALYSGAFAQWQTLFAWLTFAVSLPAVTYGAMPFYQKAWRDFKIKKMSIDTPLIFAILGGETLSFYRLLQESDQIYFDSVTALIFLVLASRFALNRLQQKTNSLDHLSDYFWQGTLFKWNSEEREYQKTLIEKINIYDQLKILSGEIVPVDSKVIKGKGYYNNSLMSGEFKSIAYDIDSVIPSGAQIIYGDVELRALSSMQDSPVNLLFDEIKKYWNQDNKTIRLADRYASYLITLSLAIGAIVFIVTSFSSMDLAINKALAIIIITCPCVLGVATPFAMIQSMKEALRRGIIIKSANALEEASKIKNIFLDKTGTITHGKYQVVSWSEESTLARSIVYALEEQSRHPIAQALLAYLKDKDLISVSLDHFEEVLGVGVKGVWKNNEWMIKNLPVNIDQTHENCYYTSLGLYQNDSLYCTISLADTIKPEALVTLNHLRKSGYKLFLLTGDSEEVARKIGSELEFKEGEILFKMTPEKKSETIKNYPYSLMIGDGANDSLALASADVGVAIQGGAALSLKSAHVYFKTNSLYQLEEFMFIARETIKIVRRNIAFSLTYNAIGIALAAFGYISPIWAALFMPTSATTVFLSTLYKTKNFRHKLQQKVSV